jgi:hypothetical protein
MKRTVKPLKGALLAIDLAGILDHTGIYIGKGYVIEQQDQGSNGKLEKVTLEEFSEGKNIQIVCNEYREPLASKKVAKRAIEMYEDYYRRTKPYNIISNNCHQFSWHSISGNTHEEITNFSTLENKIYSYYGEKLYWDELDF